MSGHRLPPAQAQALLPQGPTSYHCLTGAVTARATASLHCIPSLPALESLTLWGELALPREGRKSISYFSEDITSRTMRTSTPKKGEKSQEMVPVAHVTSRLGAEYSQKLAKQFLPLAFDLRLIQRFSIQSYP